VWQDHDLVFTAVDGNHLRPDWVSARFGKLVRKSGLPKLRLHGLRHSHATALLKAGVNPKVVQERLGHYSAACTLDAYSSVVPGLQAEAAGDVAALVFGS
jgi:integrase